MVLIWKSQSCMAKVLPENKNCLSFLASLCLVLIAGKVNRCLHLLVCCMDGS